jgi:hypothetical protein
MGFLILGAFVYDGLIMLYVHSSKLRTLSIMLVSAHRNRMFIIVSAADVLW